MSKGILYIFICSFFLLAACQTITEQPLTDSQRTEIINSVEQSFSEFSDQFVQLDIEGIMQSFAAGDEIVWANDGAVLEGRNAIEMWMRETLGPIQDWNSMEYGEAHIYILAKNAVVHSVDFDESFTLSNGDTVRVRGAWTNVFKLSDGEWKVVHSAASHIWDSDI